MKYSTNDLSRILGVSGNTIRRFDAMGYLSSDRNEENGYRVFEYADLVKLMYVTRYRKEELTHEKAALLLDSGVDDIVEALAEKQREIRKLIARYQAVDHLLKDDIMLMKRAKEHLWEFIETECNSAHFILYIQDGVLTRDKEREKAIQRFMSECPEFYYFYMFDPEKKIDNGYAWSEGVGSNIIMTEKYRIDTSWPVETYERKPCVLRFIRIPIITDREWESEKETIWRKLYEETEEYIARRNLKSAGRIMGLKIGCFKEEGRLWQYVLMHHPVEPK